MPCLITALTRSFIEKTTKKTNNKKKQNNNFTAKTKYLSLNAPSNNAKLQSYKTLSTQNYFIHTVQQMVIFINGTRPQSRQKEIKGKVEKSITF